MAIKDAIVLGENLVDGGDLVHVFKKYEGEMGEESWPIRCEKPRGHIFASRHLQQIILTSITVDGGPPRLNWIKNKPRVSRVFTSYRVPSSSVPSAKFDVQHNSFVEDVRWLASYGTTEDYMVTAPAKYLTATQFAPTC